MHCPYCGDERTDVFKTLFRRSKTYRYRRCRFCKARFRTQEKAVGPEVARYGPKSKGMGQ